MGHSSVPAWPTADPGLDPDGRSYVLLGVGAAGRRIADGWLLRARDLGRPAPAVRTTDALVAALADAVVGCRILLAGPQADVMAAYAAAIAAGAVDAEITVVVTDGPGAGPVGEHAADVVRRVLCVHCWTATRGRGEILTCAGCGVELAVQPHVSRREGAWLGVRAGDDG